MSAAALRSGLARLALATVSALATLAAAPPPPAPAAVIGEWQASNIFTVQWPAPRSAPGAVRSLFRLWDSQGNEIGPLDEWPWMELKPNLVVPPVPGVYSLEAWLEDADGNELRRETAILRFDDVPPQPAQPEDPGRWLLASEPARLRIGHPAAPQPISGIRGYAVSLDRGGGGTPCAGSGLCTVEETDLAGGIDDDTIDLGTLPEGLHYARVVAVSNAGVASPVRTAVLAVDGSLPRLSLLGLPSGWSDGPVKVTALATDSLSGMAAAGPEGPFTAIAVDGGLPATAAGDTVSGWVSGSGIHTVSFYARDAAGNVADGSPGAASPQSALVRIDEAPPQVEFAPAQDPADPERIEAVVTDPLSGPSRSRGEIAVRPAGTRARYEPLPTRLDGNRLVARWDSDSFAPGKYEFLATGFDRAGNAGRGTDRARGGRMVLVNPVKAPVALAARLSRGRLGGRLRRVGGGSLPEQEVTVTETFAGGADPARRTTVVRTGHRGAFSLRLRKGPSREVAVSFGGTRLLSRATAPALRLTVRTEIRMQASATRAAVGGPPIVFRGRVGTRGTSPSAVAGLPVELQFRYRGAAWAEFRTVETDRRGRFRYAYRFSDDDSRGVRFQFRAYVEGREGWPYGPSASRPVTVAGT